MAVVKYNRAKKELMDGTIDLINDTIKVLLVKSGYSPDNNHDFVSQITPASNELSVAGYSRQTLGTKSIDEDDTNDRGEFHCATITWASLAAGETAAAMIIFKDAGGADTANVLIAYVDTGGFPFVCNGGGLNININAEGLLQIS